MSETETMTRRQSGKLPALIIHALIFYAGWACWAMVIRPPIKEAMNGSLLFELLADAVKVLFWTVPALLLVKKFEPECFAGLKQMFTERVPLKWVLFWTLLFTVLCGRTLFVGILHGTLHINPDFWKPSSVYLIAVCITEEAVFRGWMLNATAKHETDWKMIALNAVMFLCIHFPGWIHKGMFVSAFTGFGFTGVLLFSVVVSICFLKHKNLLLPVFLHMLYDFVIDFFAA